MRQARWRVISTSWSASGAHAVHELSGRLDIRCTLPNSWYASSENGDDDDDGRTPATAFATLGAVEIPREQFLGRLRAAVAQPAPTGRWRFELDVPAPPEHLP